MSEFSQVHIQMDNEQLERRTRIYILLFWGVIMAKCFAAEWAVQTYAMPFDSLYIWVPTLAFGVVCTLVYGYVHLGRLSLSQLTGSTIASLWLACGVAAALFGVGGLRYDIIGSQHLPALFAVLMGIGYFGTGIVKKSMLNRTVGIGWWLASLLLFTQDSIDTILWFSGLIVLLQIVPTLIHLLSDIKQAKATQNRVDFSI